MAVSEKPFARSFCMNSETEQGDLALASMELTDPPTVLALRHVRKHVGNAVLCRKRRFAIFFIPFAPIRLKRGCLVCRTRFSKKLVYNAFRD